MPASSHPPVHLSVSIVLYNSALSNLERTLQSLQEAAAAARGVGRLGKTCVYLVDNASAADYRERVSELARHWPQGDDFTIQFIPRRENRGFGCGHNSVLDALTSEVHLVLNPDVELERDALSEGLCTLLCEESIVLLSPRTFGGSGQQEFLCKRYPSVLVLLLRGFAPPRLRRLFRPRLDAYEMRDLCGGDARVDVAIASGCFMLARTSALRAVSGFSEDFFLYFEDFDLSLRLGSQGRLVYEPAMRIVHRGGYAAHKGLRHLWYFMTAGITFFNRHGWRWL